jgi:uncharacterized protein (TIGR02118 family)
MVKAIYFIKRKPAMELAEFRRYWLDQHAALVRKVPELKKYVQWHTLDSGYRNHEPIYDGIAELWYADTDAMRRIADTPASRAAADDDANFIDMSQFSFVLTEERVQKEGAVDSAMPRFAAFITRKPGMAPEAFQKHWATTHGALGAKVPGIVRYVQSHVRLSAYRSGRSPRWDGVAETWFTDYEAMRAAEHTPEYRAVRSDEKNFLAGPPPFIIAREYAIV